jgi:predicted kinase
MNIEIPEFALVLLVGASGTGKSSFAAKHFLATEVVSSDRARGWVADDETDQSATPDAFDLVHAVIEKRLKNRRFTVVDATNVQPQSRKGLIALAKKWHALAVAIVFDLPEAIAVQRNTLRSDRQFGAGPVPQPAEQPLYLVAAAVPTAVQRVRSGAGCGGRDLGGDPAIGEPAAEAIGIISRVGDDGLGWGDRLDQGTAMLMSAILPGIRPNATGRPQVPSRQWILDVRPPREMQTACAHSLPFCTDCRAMCFDVRAVEHEIGRHLAPSRPPPTARAGAARRRAATQRLYRV